MRRLHVVLLTTSVIGAAVAGTAYAASAGETRPPAVRPAGNSHESPTITGTRKPAEPTTGNPVGGPAAGRPVDGPAAGKPAGAPAPAKPAEAPAAGKPAAAPVTRR